MTEGNTPAQPLATSRPWLTVAGCLGGSVVTGVVIVLAVAIGALILFFPQLIGLGPGATQTAIVTAVGELRRAPALKVATREVAVVVDASKPTEFTVRPWPFTVGPGASVEVGRTTAQIVVPGNVVQYIVPFEGLAAGEEIDVHAVKSPEGTRYVVTLPAPRVDESLVEVQSDPAKRREMVDRDWLDHLVGDDSARDAALASVREAVIEAARSDSAIFEVREKARADVAEMIRALLPAERRDCVIEVRWSDERR
jgi:hypothetical protein